MNDQIDSIKFDPESVLISRNNKIIKDSAIIDSFSSYLTIYPNPFRYIVKIDKSNPSEKIKRVQIYSLNGKLVEERDYSGYDPGCCIEVKTTIKQTGIYILRIITSQNSYVYRIMKDTD